MNRYAQKLESADVVDALLQTGTCNLVFIRKQKPKKRKAVAKSTNTQSTATSTQSTAASTQNKAG